MTHRTFRDREQLLLVCRTLCAPVGRANLWRVDGPDVEALLEWQVRGESRPISSADRMLVLAAWALWSDEDDFAFSEPILRALEVLDASHAAMLTHLLAARGEGPDSVDQWIRSRENTERPPPPDAG